MDADERRDKQDTTERFCLPPKTVVDFTRRVSAFLGGYKESRQLAKNNIKK